MEKRLQALRDALGTQEVPTPLRGGGMEIHTAKDCVMISGQVTIERLILVARGETEPLDALAA